jgi:ribonuclease HII
MQILLKPKYNTGTDLIEVGVDEAGRGALAGPVTVAACIMPADFQHPLVKDSKLLSESQKKQAHEIVLTNAIAYSVVHIDVDTIENTNILKATLIGMNQSLEEVQSSVDFDFVLIDGDQFHGYKDKSYVTVVGGDNKYTSIAAASILAKVARDNYMKSLNEVNQNKVYGWASNKGYGTKQHINAIQEVGSTPEHRASFISHLLTTTSELF